MFWTVMGYIMCVGSALFTLGYGAYCFVKFSDLPKEKQKGEALFYLIIFPITINTLYTVLAFVMMAKIPSFSWWMTLIFIAIATSPVIFEFPHICNARPIGAFILIWVHIPDSVKMTALICLITGELLKFVAKKMTEKEKKEAQEADKIAKDLGMNNAEELIDELDKSIEELDNFNKELKESKQTRKSKTRKKKTTKTAE